MVRSLALKSPDRRVETGGNVGVSKERKSTPYMFRPLSSKLYGCCPAPQIALCRSVGPCGSQPNRHLKRRSKAQVPSP